jgi:hypothetical protein
MRQLDSAERDGCISSRLKTYVIAALAVGMLALTQLREERVSTGEDIASLNLRR